MQSRSNKFRSVGLFHNGLCFYHSYFHGTCQTLDTTLISAISRSSLMTPVLLTVSEGGDWLLLETDLGGLASEAMCRGEIPVTVHDRGGGRAGWK